MGVPRNTGSAGVREQERLALIRRIATGDQSALAELYDAMSRQVYGLALRILSDTGTAEEVTLEVFTQVWKQASLFDLSRETPSAWLCTLARSRAIDRLRSGAQERRRAEPIETVAATAAVDAVDPETSAVDAERRVRVRAALDKLPTDQREAIELAYFGGYSHSEIAEQLGQPLGTIKTRIRLAMVRLRETLVDYKEDASA